VTAIEKLAMVKLSALRETGQTVDEYLRQGVSLFGDDLSPLGKDVLQVMHDYARSGKIVAAILTNYARTVESYGDPRQTSILAEAAPTKAEVWATAARKAEGSEGGIQASLFQGEGVGGSAAAQAAGRKGRLAQAEARFAEEVNKRIDDSGPPMGGSVQVMRAGGCRASPRRAAWGRAVTPQPGALHLRRPGRCLGRFAGRCPGHLAPCRRS
jgi:hypothetical protein